MSKNYAQLLLWDKVCTWRKKMDFFYCHSKKTAQSSNPRLCENSPNLVTLVVMEAVTSDQTNPKIVTPKKMIFQFWKIELKTEASQKVAQWRNLISIHVLSKLTFCH
jgi:hypothetical protein